MVSTLFFNFEKMKRYNISQHLDKLQEMLMFEIDVGSGYFATNVIWSLEHSLLSYNLPSQLMMH